ncbi:hypothetical protein PBT90_17175 [Algoriphagus halophytocola]|uniref:Uncharacterized protein n=1 Tax=Algoriphagus halophytocola TaxID=2991499 RepID=A0ABY6MCQ0_9BACT|nr:MULTISPECIES: hypothetical protein [unclassified Algoriphagus]UZD21258.1 hypothetical protein OM944_11310 [Algoriphagus sp. TR-M5]WBL42469.1 hypothetical protein PBT90_17175 [Algoriphagus sp. TR-M9]
MKRNHTNSNLFQQRLTVMLAMLLCLFISSIEYIPDTTDAEVVKVEHQDQNPPADQDQTFVGVAVDAVVPFVVNVSHHTLYLIYEIVRYEGSTFVTETASVFQPNQLVEILFERIISTKGP